MISELQSSFDEIDLTLSNLTSSKFTETLQLQKAEILDALPNFMTKVEFENIKEELDEKIESLEGMVSVSAFISDFYEPYLRSLDQFMTKEEFKNESEIYQKSLREKQEEFEKLQSDFESSNKTLHEKYTSDILKINKESEKLHQAEKTVEHCRHRFDMKKPKWDSKV